MKASKGFTAVELLITMIIGTLLLVTAYQLYSFVLNDNADTRMRATASNLAYRFMREKSSSAQKPCASTQTFNLTSSIPASANLPAGSTATVEITCVNTGVTLSYITSTVTYGSKSTRHATYLPPN